MAFRAPFFLHFRSTEDIVISAPNKFLIATYHCHTSRQPMVQFTSHATEINPSNSHVITHHLIFRLFMRVYDSSQMYKTSQRSTCRYACHKHRVSYPPRVVALFRPPLTLPSQLPLRIAQETSLHCDNFYYVLSINQFTLD